MTTQRRPHNSTLPASLEYKDVSYQGSASLYRNAHHKPAVPLATFSGRIKRLAKALSLSSAAIDEALYSSAKDFQLRYGIRKTWVSLADVQVDLFGYYQAALAEKKVSYPIFRTRVKAIERKGRLEEQQLLDALTLTSPSWKTFYGGGRHKPFVYDGEAYPALLGVKFNGASALLRKIGRYADRALVWSRLKAGWPLDDALTVPVAYESYRTGSIYLITRRKTNQAYVGLTLTSIEQRWGFHVRFAEAGGTTKLAQAIRADGRDGFELSALETGIDDIRQLQERERYWMETKGALGQQGLNSAKAGGLGSRGGKAIEVAGIRYRSITEASQILSKELGLPQHSIHSRLQNGQALPTKVRRHSKHPDAGSNLFRRWLALLKRYPAGLVSEWRESYDKFKLDVSPVPSSRELVRKVPDEPWGPNNFEWIDTQTKIERIHGKVVVVQGVTYPSIKSVAIKYKIGFSTLKDRIGRQGMSIDAAVSMPLAVTSCKRIDASISVDGQIFRSKRQAILYIAETRELTEGQAKYRFSLDKY